MQRRVAKGAGASHEPARSSSFPDKEDAQAQGFAGADVAAAEANEEDVEKARVAGGGGGGGAAAAAVAEKMEWWEQWPWWTWGMAGEEAMSFGSVWSPFWDVEFMGDEAYDALFGDVAWDDDLWSLKDLEKPKA